VVRPRRCPSGRRPSRSGPRHHSPLGAPRLGSVAGHNEAPGAATWPHARTASAQRPRRRQRPFARAIGGPRDPGWLSAYRPGYARPRRANGGLRSRLGHAGAKVTPNLDCPPLLTRDFTAECSGGETRTLNLVVNSHPLCLVELPRKRRHATTSPRTVARPHAASFAKQHLSSPTDFSTSRSRGLVATLAEEQAQAGWGAPASTHFSK